MFSNQENATTAKIDLQICEAVNDLIAQNANRVAGYSSYMHAEVSSVLNLLNQQTHEGETALHFCASRNLERLLKFLFESGISQGVVESSLPPPCWEALYCKNYNLVRAFLKRGAQLPYNILSEKLLTLELLESYASLSSKNHAERNIVLELIVESIEKTSGSRNFIEANEVSNLRPIFEAAKKLAAKNNNAEELVNIHTVLDYLEKCHPKNNDISFKGVAKKISTLR